MKINIDRRVFPMKAVLLVSNVFDALARAFFEIFDGHRVWTPHLTRQHNSVRRAQCFASHSGKRVSRQICIQYSIGNPVAYLVWVAFGYGFARKQITTLWQCSDLRKLVNLSHQAAPYTAVLGNRDDRSITLAVLV